MHLNVSSDSEFTAWWTREWYTKNIKDFRAKYGKHDDVWNANQLKYRDFVRKVNGAGIKTYSSLIITYIQNTGEITGMRTIQERKDNLRNCPEP